MGEDRKPPEPEWSPPGDPYRCDCGECTELRQRRRVTWTDRDKWLWTRHREARKRALGPDAKSIKSNIKERDDKWEDIDRCGCRECEGLPRPLPGAPPPTEEQRFTERYFGTFDIEQAARAQGQINAIRSATEITLLQRLRGRAIRQLDYDTWAITPTPYAVLEKKMRVPFRVTLVIFPKKDADDTVAPAPVVVVDQTLVWGFTADDVKTALAIEHADALKGQDVKWSVAQLSLSPFSGNPNVSY